MPEVRATADQLRAAHDVYRRALEAMANSGLPFLVGGAYAFAEYTSIRRFTKDFDVFVRPEDVDRVLATLDAGGFRVERPFPHWLAKAYHGEDFLDLIYSSGNGVARVDGSWFEHAVDAAVFGRPVKLVPVEEILWTKSFIMERERYDGADVLHLLRARAETLDWKRLLERFGAYWRVLYCQLVLFGFVYPGERPRIPDWVLLELGDRLEAETRTPPPTDRVCQGTILSRQQYLPDIERWGYHDARVFPRGHMSPEDTAVWTAAIENED